MTAKEDKALAILRRLREHGFIALFNGGCVRDRLLGLPIKDYDIATDARPEVVQRLFDNTVAVGAQFGVIMAWQASTDPRVTAYTLELSGPVGIVKETASAARSGAHVYLKLLGALSAYLGGFNLLPLPALDGGRLLFLGF